MPKRVTDYCVKHGQQSFVVVGSDVGELHCPVCEPELDVRRAYIAGPLFSDAERSFNLLLDTIAREAGFETYLPQRDAPVLGQDNGNDVFGEELRANENADLIVANLDGVDVDSGTAFEIGYAIARGKSVIGIRTDWRAFSPNERVNLMIEQSSFIVENLSQLKAALLAWGND